MSIIERLAMSTFIALILALVGSAVHDVQAAPATYVMPKEGSALRKEAARLRTPANLPGDNCSRWKYHGYAKRDMTNGRERWSVKSRIKGKAWHTYTVAKPVGLGSDGQCRR